ncbi:TetR/AcrR family transcriptional regulator [Streptomyces sp. NBC_01803]|uniref:TetR/AcrR family transcriptional regulator n=1 Tax=Streptomyces sp. NBC_01803 TaxID=2975946 RepID=UPI002DDC1D4B|nr:TetR family transcriptional regulator [Streptomyces sp. NBC_01803]WSA43823.1 TetR/AcrR family transcriptional regulator [Streptomyces sp. NBC_01803]
MRAERPKPPRGRQREAGRNDERLLRAARQVFADFGWDAPVSLIARRAGIGMGSLYRRYGSKEDLVRRIQLVAMARLTEVAEEAGARVDPWEAFVEFMRRALRPDNDGGMLSIVGGRLAATPEIDAAAERLRVAVDALVQRAQAAGALREDVGAGDVMLSLDHLNARLPAPTERVEQLHRRYVDLLLDGLRAPAARPLSGPAPSWTELKSMWHAGPTEDDDAG